jgi:hypothetical protein
MPPSCFTTSTTLLLDVRPDRSSAGRVATGAARLGALGGEGTRRWGQHARIHAGYEEKGRVFVCGGGVGGRVSHGV